MDTYNLKVTLELEEDGRWSAWLASYPACGAWGDTRQEALEALTEMAVVFLEVMEEAGEPVYPDSVEQGNSLDQKAVDAAGCVSEVSVYSESISIPVHA